MGICVRFPSALVIFLGLVLSRYQFNDIPYERKIPLEKTNSPELLCESLAWPSWPVPLVSAFSQIDCSFFLYG